MIKMDCYKMTEFNDESEEDVLFDDSFNGSFLYFSFSNNLQNLHSVCGIAKTGNILSVMGPQGSGKSALIRTLSGDGVDVFCGTFSLCGQTFKESRQKMEIIEKTDLFLPTITVREALESSARLQYGCVRLQSHHRVMIDNIVEEFGIEGMLNKVILTLRPEELKRLSIAISAMSDPKVLILDEPLTGLGMNDALGILMSLKNYATNKQKIILLTMQPGPSILYSLCTSFMFLCNGETIFHGPESAIGDFLESLGTDHTNIAFSNIDRLYEILSGMSSKYNNPLYESLMETAQICRSTVEKRIQLLNRWYLDVSGNGIHTSPAVQSPRYSIKNDQGRLLDTSDGHLNHYSAIDMKQSVKMKPTQNQKKLEENTSWWCQMVALFVRNFHCTRRRILSPVSFIQNAYILLLCVLIWWRPERNENTIKDRMGLFFFTTVQWAFFALLDAVITFPDEIQIVLQEIKRRKYGSFIYCISKTLSGVPLTVVQPLVFLTVIYWIANLNGVHAFLGSLAVLVINILTTQSLGLVIGSLLRLPWNITAMALTLLSMMLLGGAFNTPPSWMRWGKYFSLFNYGVDAFAVLEFQDAEPIRCTEDSKFPPCFHISNQTFIPDKVLPSDTVLTMLGITWGSEIYVTVLCVLFVIFQVTWCSIVYYKSKRRL